MTQPPSGIFPEINKPPYFYAEAGGKWAKINENWSFRLTEVLSDNRCPYGYKSCETCGEAKVKVQFMQPDVDYYKAYFETLKVLGLNRYPMPDGTIKPTMLVPAIINRKHTITNKQIGFRITLADLRPYPEKDFVNNVNDILYTGLFFIEANNS